MATHKHMQIRMYSLWSTWLPQNGMRSGGGQVGFKFRASDWLIRPDERAFSHQIGNKYFLSWERSLWVYSKQFHHSWELQERFSMVKNIEKDTKHCIFVQIAPCGQPNRPESGYNRFRVLFESSTTPKTFSPSSHTAELSVHFEKWKTSLWYH